MTRVRSPNFPIIGLPQAISRARKIFDKEQQLAAGRDVLSKHLGYSGYNGKSAKVLSALIKYGLLEPTKDGRFRLSSRAMRILFPRTDADKQAALDEAGAAPALFKDIRNEWGAGSPSDENLANYLLHRGFSQSAIAPAIAAFRETQTILTPVNGQNDSGENLLEEEDDDGGDMLDLEPNPSLRREDESSANLGRKPTGRDGEPFTVQFVKGGLLGSFDLRNKDDLTTFVAGLNALAVFLPSTPVPDGGDTSGS